MPNSQLINALYILYNLFYYITFFPIQFGMTRTFQTNRMFIINDICLNLIWENFNMEKIALVSWEYGRIVGIVFITICNSLSR